MAAYVGLARRGNTIPNRVAAEARYPHGRIALPVDGGCAAVLKLGQAWAKLGRPVMCSGRALPDNLFCGRHDHLNLLCGEAAETFLGRAFRRAQRRPSRGLRFADDELDAMEQALAEFWGGVS